MADFARIEQKEAPALTRSASVREPPKSYHSAVPTVGGLNHQSGDISQEQPPEKSKTPRDAKRRTVQVEYVAPQSQTTRGDTTGGLAAIDSPGSAEGIRSDAPAAGNDSEPVPLRHDTSGDTGLRQKELKTATTEPTAPLTGKTHRSNSDTTAFAALHTGAPQNTRPTTGGSMGSFTTGRLPSRGSYGQPVAPTVAATNAEGRLAQPKSKQYGISSPIQQEPTQSSDAEVGRPSAQQLPSKFNTTPRQEPPKGHKRSNTVSGISEKLFGRSGSIFGGRTAQPSSPRPKPAKRYPPTSMKGPLAGDGTRMSMDSRRSMQYGSKGKANESGEGRPRRFSLLPPSFSLKSFTTSSRSQTPDEESQTPRMDPYQQRPSTGLARTRTRATTYGTQDPMGMVSEGPGEEPIVHEEPVNYQSHIDNQFAALHGTPSNNPSYTASSAERVDDQRRYTHHPYANQSAPNYYGEYGGTYDSLPRQSMQVGRPIRGGVLQKNRKFADAYEYERDMPHQAGTSGAARKVMDFFRRRAKSRAGDDR